MTARTDMRKYYPGVALIAEPHWLDNEDLEFGDNADVTLKWNSTNTALEFLPATDNVGAINIGNGVLDIDFKVFMGAAAAHVTFDIDVARVIFEATDLRLMDADILEFGDDADVAITWDGGSLNIVPLTNNVGVIEIGNGTNDIDVQIFMNTAAQSVLFDVDVSRVIFEGTDLRLMNDDILEFGDDADVTMAWDDSALNILPLTPDTGVINIGSVTHPLDMKVFLLADDANNFFEFDVGRSRLYLQRAATGGADARGLYIVVIPMAGTEGWRQGAINIEVTRQSGQDFADVWDGNPDCGIKCVVTNDADNVTSRGMVRGVDIQARNDGVSLATVQAGSFNARISGGASAEVDNLHGIFITLEAYDAINTEAVGLDITMLIEDDSGGGVRTGIRVRNTDQSSQPAVENVFLISHTSTNGFVNLFYFNAATGDCVAAGDLVPAHDPDGSSIGADAYAVCSINGTPYYIALYDGVA